MTANAKCFNMKVVHLVDAVDFDIRNVLIGVRMQKLRPKMHGCIRMAGHSRNDHPGFGFLRGWSDTPGLFVRVFWFFCRRLQKTATILLKMTSDQKTFNMKVVRLVEMVKFSFGRIFIWGSLWRVCVKKTELMSQTCINPSTVNNGNIWTGFGVLFLHGKSIRLLYT